MSDNNTSQNEEVDLGQLFTMIGNLFTKFFNFIASIFKGLFHVLILILIHFYKEIKWYVAAVVLGVVIGYILDKNADDRYGANMFIETNFNSSRQVYENIQDLNQLAYEDQDSTELAKRLGIKVSEAASIKEFSIEPDIDPNTKMLKFNEYKMQLDSVSRLTASFEDFEEGLSVYSYKTHKIGVVTTDKLLFKKLSTALVLEITANDYLKELQKVAIANLGEEVISIEKEQIESDSLANEYLKLRIKESEKEVLPGTGTNFFLGATEEQSILVNESTLFQKKYTLDIRKRGIQRELVQQQNIVNVIADFPSSGYDVSTWTQKWKFTLPILFFSIVFLGSLLFALRKYLAEQEKKILNS